MCCLANWRPLTDSDGDGVADATDNCPDAANADQADFDTDGVGDACDNCTEVANVDQIDTNGDGFGNICDADVTNDGTINFNDLNELKAAFFTNTDSPNWDPDLDFDSDGLVNFNDLNVMKANFFGAPGPSGLVP